MKLKTKDLLTLSELSPKEFTTLIDYSIILKKESTKDNKSLLKNKTLAMIFQKPSTRTRVSFEAGMFQLGGHAINLSSQDMQLSRGETIEDTAKTLSRYVDCIMARVYDHSLLEKLSESSSVPVINGLSNSFHPCQILADFMTIKEKQHHQPGLCPPDERCAEVPPDRGFQKQRPPRRYYRQNNLAARQKGRR
jgi:ornithine carbamoyltransferase